MHMSPVAALKIQFFSDFLVLQLRKRHCRHGQSYHHLDRFHKDLQVLGSKSQSYHWIDTPDLLIVQFPAALCNMARFATIEAETMTRVSLHWVGMIQVHRLGG